MEREPQDRAEGGVSKDIQGGVTSIRRVGAGPKDTFRACTGPYCPHCHAELPIGQVEAERLESGELLNRYCIHCGQRLNITATNLAVFSGWVFDHSHASRDTEWSACGGGERGDGSLPIQVPGWIKSAVNYRACTAMARMVKDLREKGLNAIEIAREVQWSVRAVNRVLSGKEYGWVKTTKELQKSWNKNKSAEVTDRPDGRGE